MFSNSNFCFTIFRQFCFYASCNLLCKVLFENRKNRLAFLIIKNMETEVWKDIQGYEGLYQISNIGRVKSLERKVSHSKGGLRQVNKRILKNLLNKYGYAYVKLNNTGKKYFSLHRLVALNFIANPENYKQVNHKDFNKLNNNVSNLEWCSCTMNIRYDWLHKRREHQRKISSETIAKSDIWRKGSEHSQAKLNDAQVLKIREMVKTKSHMEIAKLFGVSRPTITLIANRKLWRHI